MSAAEGLRASDALAPVDVPCSHQTCIHADHGPWPVPLADQHSGVRLVDGVPTRYVPVQR